MSESNLDRALRLAAEHFQKTGNGGKVVVETKKGVKKMNESIKIKTDFVPSWCKWFTAGKVYAGTRFGLGENLVTVVDDEGEKIKVYLPESVHIDLRAWEVIE